MFFGSRRRKATKAVTDQIRPLFADIKRLIGPLPPEIANDKYVLGYIIAYIGLIMLVESDGRLSATDKGLVLFEGIKTALGDIAPSSEQLTTLLETENENADFVRGAEAAKKIMCVTLGWPDYDGDPEIAAARSGLLTAGKSLDFLTPGSSENIKVAGLLQSRLFFQYITQRYGNH